MNTDKDGGNAFPIPGLQDDPDFNGLSVRDYFAAKADVSIYGPADALTTKLGRLPSMKELAEYVAQLRWLEADAMLAARGAQ